MRKFGCIALLFFLLWAALAEGEEIQYIRVISREDTKEAQLEKYRVRDAILLLLYQAEDVNKMLPAIERRANQIAPCSISIRSWGPKGMEEAPTLYIRIGQGQGPNWWGILYPKGVAWAGEREEGVALHFIWPLWARVRGWLGW